ncbi:hypothetical protein PO909_017485 [Leuciscus waleckii]
MNEDLTRLEQHEELNLQPTKMTFITILIWTLAVLCRESVGQETVTQTPSERLYETGQSVTVTCKTSRNPDCCYSDDNREDKHRNYTCSKLTYD